MSYEVFLIPAYTYRPIDSLLPVNSGDNPLEEPFEGGLGDGLDGELYLALGLCLGHVVTTNLNIHYH